jgi:hypothetical protein
MLAGLSMCMSLLMSEVEEAKENRMANMAIIYRLWCHGGSVTRFSSQVSALNASSQRL